MSTAEQPRFVSVDEYLSAEEFANTKSEYVDGWVRAMSGASNRHNKIKANALGCLWSKLRNNPCTPFDSDAKIRIRKIASTKFYYPDLSVVCDENLPTEAFQDRPVLLVEVLSKSTRAIDLDEKLESYLTIESLQWYVVFEQHKPMAIVLRRTEQGFLREIVEGLDAEIELPMLGLQLPLAEIYAGVDFTPNAVHESEFSYEIQ